MLDDIDARPGSTVSLLRTFIGLYLRDLGGWIATRDLITLMGEAGIGEQATRNGIARLKSKELLLPETNGHAGYRVNDAAIPMLERGDRRIFEVRAMHEDDPWCLVSFTVEERQRNVRHQLRRRLQWLGCGTVAPALWIAPARLRDEILTILDTLGVEATVFLATDPVTPRGITAWWDLETIARAHHVFLAETERLTGSAFADYLTLVDRWRPIPYLDPGLPPSLLPDDWPGTRSAARFTEHHETLADAARDHVNSETPASAQRAAALRR